MLIVNEKMILEKSRETYFKLSWMLRRKRELIAAGVDSETAHEQARADRDAHFKKTSNVQK